MYKTLYFLVCCLIGMILFFPLHNIFMKNPSAYGGAMMIDNVTNLEGIVVINTCAAEGIAFLIVMIVVLFAPLLAWLIRPLIPVSGTVYAICEGYFIGFITESLVPQYRWISFAAFIITAVLVAVMLFLYKNEYVKVTKKFRTIVFDLFFTSILSGLFMFLLSFVPFLRPVILQMTSFMGSPVVSIVLSVVYIIIAALFLVVDFDTIKKCVENNMPKKFEWMASFGLTYTIIYIYFKILNLLLQIVAAGNNKNKKRQL